jgi:glutaredoxin
MAASGEGTAVLYRMVMPDHLCPSGLLARDLLRRRGFVIEDRPLRSRAEVEALMVELGVQTTPQAFIGGQRIGSYDDLRRHFGQHVAARGEPNYRPVITLFAVSAALALAASQAVLGTPVTLMAVEWFVGFSMVILAMQKLRDPVSFARMFLGYDLLARRFVPYAFAYPWLEFGGGVLMIAGLVPWLVAPVMIATGLIGAVSVAKAVWIDRRSLKCACVGGDQNVPLGTVSFLENAIMVAMGLWMAAGLAGWVPMGMPMLMAMP